MKKFLLLLFSLLIVTSCSKNDDEFNSQNIITSNVFKKEFLSWTYQKNTNNLTEIDISTNISVQLEHSNFTNGVHLIVLQNFRIHTKQGNYIPATLTDSIFVTNNTTRHFTINGSINYANASQILEEPEVKLHDRRIDYY